MQLWVCCALLVFVAGGCLAQKPSPCQSGPLLEGHFGVVAQNGNYMVFGKYSYDAQLQRIRLRDPVRLGNSTVVMDSLLLYQEKVMYLMDYKQQTCKKQALTSKFNPMQIPPSSFLLGQAVLGSSSAPEEGVLVNTWIGGIPDVEGYIMTFTEFGCFPISVGYRSQKTDSIGYNPFNSTRGIEDPTVFIPPPFCQDTTLEAGNGNFFSAFI